jgi:hypothetical protein
VVNGKYLPLDNRELRRVAAFVGVLLIVFVGFFKGRDFSKGREG